MAQNEEQSIINYFVDEAGDPNLFDRRGRIIIGNDGCSSYFMLGKLAVDNIESLALALDGLRAELLADPYFKGVPSMHPAREKTAISFHANSDLPEVRREVFRLLMQPEFNLKFYVVVRSKTDLLAFIKQKNVEDRVYKYNGNQLYDNLTTELFSSMHKTADYIDVSFAKRGDKTRTKAFEEALMRAEDIFESRFGLKRPSQWAVRCCQPEKAPGLQAVDYFLWAVQRFYEKKENRFLDLIYPKLGEIHDLDRVKDGRKGVRYNSSNILGLDYFSG